MLGYKVDDAFKVEENVEAGPKMNETQSDGPMVSAAVNDGLPAHWDWRTYGWVSAVKNQGPNFLY